MADNPYGAGNFGGGPQQIIGGTQYEMYSPAWYDAMNANKIKKASVAGQAVNAFSQNAMPGLQGALTGALSGAAGGGGTGATGTGSFTGGTGTPGTSGSNAGYGGMSQLPTLSLPDQQRASEAAFATEKDRAGQLARSGLESLRGELGSTGQLGSGAEVQGVRDIIQSGQGLMGQANRDIAMKQADLGADFAKTGYLGGITMRGQDVAQQEAMARLAQERELQASRLSFEQQQLASQRQLSLMQMALGGLQGLGGSLY